jgi:hypothetical protein
MAIALLVSILLCTGAAVGFVYLERYTQAVQPIVSSTGPLRIVNPPYWYNDHLARMIAAAADGAEFELVPDTARKVGEKLSTIAWLKNVKVKTLKDGIEVLADFRTPVALVEVFGRDYYLDAEPIEQTNDVVVHVLDYIPIGKLPIVKITGISSRALPPIGSQVDSEDIVEAVKLIPLLHRADTTYNVAQPLVNEISRIDVSNYGNNTSEPQIVIIAHDGTKVRWGAAVGQSARYFEASENEKLGQLYSFYKANGTIQAVSHNLARYIDLMVPQNRVPQP